MPAVKSSKVVVAVRLKPEARLARRCCFVTSEYPDHIQVGEKSFQYDHVYDEDCSQEQIYDNCLAGLVQGCFKGFNATMFAYGQTGSGKTYSTMGLPRVSEEEGIIPRALRDVFTELNNTKATNNKIKLASIHVSFLEIYNEECKDLLHPDIPSREIMIREDRDGKIFVTGAREEIVSDVDMALHLLESGNLQRTTAGTHMNATSSRSHAIFSINLELFEYKSELAELGTGEGSYIQSKLHLVDLAGSERAKKTRAQGLRLKESVGINQGLLALGKVIRALTAYDKKKEEDGPCNDGAGNEGNGKRGTHIPYRESKLTRFLQDSLGGNSRTVMLACISPNDTNMHETLSTLQYATRARAVQNKVKANIRAAPIQSQYQRNTKHSPRGDKTPTKVGEGKEAMTPGAQEALENSLVNALRLQCAQLQKEMLRMREEHESNNYGRGLKTGGAFMMSNEAESNVLRSSVVSLYDSISASGQVIVGSPKVRPQSPLKGDEVIVASVVPRLQKLKTALEVGVDHVALNDSRALNEEDYLQGNFWPVLQASIVGANELEDLVDRICGMSNGRVSLAKAFYRATQPSSGPEAEQQVEILRLQEELKQCYDDLAKDEEVFADKIRDLKKAKKAIRTLEEDKKALEVENEDLSQQLRKFQDDAPLSSYHDTLNKAQQQQLMKIKKAEEVVIKTRSESKLSDHIDDDNDNMRFDEFVEQNSSMGYERNSFDEVDELELSTAVLSCEPPIASLMDDLDTIQEEKDRLILENQQAEMRSRVALQEATQQRQEYQNKQESLMRKLKELEVGIRLKQECISELARSESEAKKVTREQLIVSRDLKLKTERLEEQLFRLQQTATDAQDEKTRRQALENELSEMKTLTRKYERKVEGLRKDEARRRQDKEKADAALLEMHSLKSEHSKLKQALDYNDSRYRKDLDSLTSQVNRYKRQEEESSQHIKEVEAKNQELRTRLERSAKMLKDRESRNYGKNNDVGSLGSGASVHSGTSGSPSRGGPRSFASTISRSHSKTAMPDPAKGDGSVYANADDSGVGTVPVSAATLFSWIQKKVDDYVGARHAHDESTKLWSKCKEIEKEQAELRSEYDMLRKQQNDGHSKIERQQQDVETRLVRCQEQLKQAPFGTNRFKDLEHIVFSLDQHNQELKQRLQEGVLSRDKISRMHDLAEEMETLSAELELNSVRLEEERRKMAKVKNVADMGSKQSQEAKRRAEVTALLNELVRKRRSEQLGGLGDNVCEAMALLAQQLVEARGKSSQYQHDILTLQCQIDDMEAERDEVIGNMHKLRNDGQRKVEAARKEGNDKARALLQKISALETERQETHNVLRRSFDVPSVNMQRLSRDLGSNLSMSRDSVNSLASSRQDSLAGRAHAQPQSYQQYDATDAAESGGNISIFDRRFGNAQSSITSDKSFDSENSIK